MLATISFQLSDTATHMLECLWFSELLSVFPSINICLHTTRSMQNFSHLTMMNPQTTATNPPLNPSFYKLDDQEARFFKLMTGIQDDAELKEHILRVQAKAYSVYEYPCIRRFAFLNLKISRMPAYERVLKMGQERPGAILLDMGCCFGNDARKAVADGWPIQNVVASDLRQVFWDAGHELFRTTPEAFPLKFVPGDVFDSAHVAPREPFYEPPSTPAPDLQSLTSLTLLQGHVSAIHASSFVHLFTQEQQTLVCKVLASLLSPDPGSTIFGSHVGLPKNGIRARPMTGGDMDMFCHDPNSYKELWHQIFGKGGINVEVQGEVIKRDVVEMEADSSFYLMTWSVTRT